MCAYVCCLLVALLTAPISESTAAQLEAMAPPETDLLISRNEAIADISQVSVNLDTIGATYASSHERLAAEVVAKLKGAGIDHVGGRILPGGEHHVGLRIDELQHEHTEPQSRGHMHRSPPYIWPTDYGY